ncbi:MAG TPA: DUF1778 domain-containing protein [Solirubrobacterales bacterium]
MATPKTQRLNLRIEKGDEALFKQAAMVNRESLTQFLVESGRERAEQVLADRTSFRVDAEAWEEMVAAMDRPATARPDLARLFSRPRPE